MFVFHIFLNINQKNSPEGDGKTAVFPLFCRSVVSWFLNDLSTEGRMDHYVLDRYLSGDAEKTAFGLDSCVFQDQSTVICNALDDKLRLILTNGGQLRELSLTYYVILTRSHYRFLAKEPDLHCLSMQCYIDESVNVFIWSSICVVERIIWIPSSP